MSGRIDGDISQFCSITGASARDARKFLEAHKRLDIAIDAYYNNPNAFSNARRKGDTAAPSSSKINQLFDKYKDPEDDDITIDGTIKFCEDLEVDPEDVVLLAVAYELKSPQMGRWTRQGWVDGWKSIGADSIPAMKNALVRLRDQLASDPAYFKKVYNNTFDFARSEGQRSLVLDTAQALWGLLIPHGLKGGALARTSPSGDSNEAIRDGGWTADYTQWWFDFLNQKGPKGVSKDTWAMFLDFIRSINGNFSNYDMEAAWPSTIDNFVEYAKERFDADI